MSNELTVSYEHEIEGLDMRPQAPIPLTLEEHRELGAEMRAINARLQALCKMMVSIYGPHAQASFTFQKAAEDMNRLCQDLQAQASKDLPGHMIDGLYL